MSIYSKLAGFVAAAALAIGLGAGGAQAHQPHSGEGWGAAGAAFSLQTPGLFTIAGDGTDAFEAGETVDIAQRQRRRGARRGRGARQRGVSPRRGASPRRGQRSRSSRRSRRGRDIGAGVAIGLGAAILGSIMSQQRAQGHGRAAYEAELEAAARRCAQRFRSFDWESGTYVTYGGEVRLCPYLEPYVY